MKLRGARGCLRWSNHDGFQLGAAAGQQGLAMQHRGPVGSEHDTSALNRVVCSPHRDFCLCSNPVLL